MTGWNDLPRELKDRLVDHAAVNDHPIYDGTRKELVIYPTMRSLLQLERATSDRAAAHIWKASRKETSLKLPADMKHTYFGLGRQAHCAEPALPGRGDRARRGHLVQHFSLRPSTCDTEMLSAISQLIKHLPSLQSLDLCGPPALLRAIADRLPGSARVSVQELALEGWSTPWKPEDTDCAAAADLLRALPSVADVKLVILKADGAADLEHVLRSLTSLTTLELNHLQGLELADLGGPWRSRINALSLGQGFSPSQAAPFLHAHSDSLTSLVLCVDADMAIPFHLNLSHLVNLAVELSSVPASLPLLTAFHSSPLVNVHVVVWADMDDGRSIVEELIRMFEGQKETLKKLALQLHTNEMSEEDESAIEELEEVLKDVELDVDVEIDM